MITKAIIPVAGLGTRFLPVTKTQPKEMLPIVDKPIVQYIVEEAAFSGIRDIILVTGSRKEAIENYFDTNFALEYYLKKKGKKELLKKVQETSSLANFYYVRQKVQRGDGDAVAQAKGLIGQEPCAVLFGDEIVFSRVPCLKQMIKVFEKYQDPIIALRKVSKEEVSHYGIVKAKKVEERVYQISSLVEKPSLKEAPSNLAIIGKYIITPDVLEALEKIRSTPRGEIGMLEGLQTVLRKRPVYGYEFEGERYDCGSKIGFLKATVEFGLRHKEVGEEFRRYLKNLKCQNVKSQKSKVKS